MRGDKCVLFTVVPLVKVVAEKMPVHYYDRITGEYREYFPWVNSSQVILSDKASWPQHRCLILYAPPKVNSRAIEHWAIQFGYSVSYLAYWTTDDPILHGGYDSQIFIGHADVVSVRRAFASRGLRCLEWAHLRDPRARILSHVAHLQDEGELHETEMQLHQMVFTMRNLEDGIVSSIGEQKLYFPHNALNLYNTMTYMFTPKEFMSVNNAQDIDDNVDNAFEVILSLGGFSLNKSIVECALRVWVSYLGPPVGKLLSDGTWV